MIRERISDETGLNLHTLARIVASANHRYKVYYIPKRRGGRRRIQHPSRELKFIQRWISYNVLSKLPVHEAATAYREAINVRHVASMHRQNNFLMILDFANFFDSMNQKDVFDVLQQNRHLLDPTLDPEDYRIISRVATKDSRLTIGAPSSPWLSNAIMYDFDVTISQICNQAGVAYSRYADDMHFSTEAPWILTQVASMVRGKVEHLQSPNLILNEQKTVFTSRKHKRMVVGLTLTPDKHISIGRKRKRTLKGLLFRFGQGRLSTRDMAYLAGYLSFVKSVEPSLLGRLSMKYGADVVAAAMRPKSAEEGGARWGWPATRS